MKYLIITLLFVSSFEVYSQNLNSFTKYDTLVNNSDSLTLRVSTFVDSVFLSSFETTISDTTIEIKRGGFPWTKKYRFETHVFGEKRNYKRGSNPTNIRICGNPTGITYVSRLDENK